MLPSYFKGAKSLILIGIIWIPIVFCVGSLFYSFSGAPILVTFWIVTPILYFNLFFVLSTWYICKNFPLDPKNLANFLIRHLISAISMVSIWLLLSYAYIYILDYFFPRALLSNYFLDSIYLFTGVGFFLYFLGVLFHYTVLVQQQAQETLQHLNQIELTAKETQLRALHTSINPHFLFNSLTALSTLTVKNPDQAQEMCVQLSEFLRYNLQYEEKQFTTIREELENIHNYLAIEQKRLGERLKINMEIDKNVHSVKTIPFLLLPLVENAIKHGIQQSVLGGTLHFQIKPQENYLWIRVSNTLEERKSVDGLGMGLKTLKKRLAAQYGKQFRLDLNQDDSMFSVDLKLPRQWKKE
jgi:sensor histidine kinase YesM